jgi:hypothetical protein
MEEKTPKDILHDLKEISQTFDEISIKMKITIVINEENPRIVRDPWAGDILEEKHLTNRFCRNFINAVWRLYSHFSKEELDTTNSIKSDLISFSNNKILNGDETLFEAISKLHKLNRFKQHFSLTSFSMVNNTSYTNIYIDVNDKGIVDFIPPTEDEEKTNISTYIFYDPTNEEMSPVRHDPTCLKYPLKPYNLRDYAKNPTNYKNPFVPTYIVGGNMSNNDIMKIFNGNIVPIQGKTKLNIKNFFKSIQQEKHLNP